MPITELRIEGLRTIEKLRLKLDGLTVLIGDNGTGKSSIVEACEILRRATGERFLDEFYAIHGGLSALLRQGASQLKLGVTIKPSRSPHGRPEWHGNQIKAIEYDLIIKPNHAFATIEEYARFRLGLPRVTKSKRPPAQRPSPLFDDLFAMAEATLKEGWNEVFTRQGKEFATNEGHGWSRNKFNTSSPILSQVSPEIEYGDWGYTAAQQVAIALRKLHVHLPFEVMPSWAARSLDRKSALRTPSPFAPASHLEKLGLNLANAFHALKNNYSQEEWQQTLSYVRLGLGENIEDVSTWADPSGGNIGLSIKFKNLDRQVPSSQLSDGMLTYLAFVALFRLHGTQPSLVALDEPDLHLHPRLLMRVLDMFESMSRESPVLLATHSDRLLDGLSDPARSVVLCELDEKQATRLFRPDPRALAKWLERYRGLGDIRGAGHEASVLTRKEPA